jgi:uncharacterized protein YbbK (DUF523 family)
VSYWRRQLFAHPTTAQGHPLVGCSACLLGEKVRYDGGHKLQASFEHGLLPWLQLQAICPEVGIGLGVPRPTLKLIGSDIGARIVQVEDESCDVTNTMLDYADSYLRRLGRFWPLSAYVFKARSPSCDVDSGIFATRFKLWAPWLKLYREEDLQTQANCSDLLLHSYVCRDILWRGDNNDLDRINSHYSELLGQEMVLDKPDLESLWSAVRQVLERQTEDARQALVERYRVEEPKAGI